MLFLLYLITVSLSLSATFLATSAFTYTFGNVSECGDLSLSWTGGTPPFKLLIIPVFGVPRNVSIPDSAFDNGQGSFSFPFPVAAEKQPGKQEQVLLTMSDATGFNTGGTTNLITVAPSQGGSCDTANPSIPFSFQLNSALQQCRPFLIGQYDGAQQPVTIGAAIPGGNITTLTPPVGPTSFTWDSNVARGTSLVFFIFDALGRSGGSSDLFTVTSSDDDTCLNSQSPSTTSGSPSSSSTASVPDTSSTSGAGSSPPVTEKNGISIAAIAGTVIGSLLFLAVIITLGLFFLRKRQDASKVVGPYSRRTNSGFDPSYSNLAPPDPRYGAYQEPGNPLSSAPHSPNVSNPFLDSRSTQHSTQFTQPTETGHFEHLPYVQGYHSNFTYPPSQTDLRTTQDIEPFPLTQPNSSASRNTMSSSQSKTALSSQAGFRPTRFVLHTDAEDNVLPDEGGVVELPPQYSERRGPPKDNPPLLNKNARHPP